MMHKGSDKLWGVGQVSQKESNKRWRDNNPEKYRIINNKGGDKYRSKRENKDKINKAQREHRQHIKEGAACDIIKKHSEDMKDDPERLTTEFMKSIVNIECDD